ncbi:phosphotransferase [Paenibacillus sp. FSL H7-0716]|uniref:Aminoglycoside phosphotransferase domain-containing protein n=1 Tax=Paenibacillus odorifer TaxID=189426 RepID=A0AB36JKC6_9BACL|nr:phosphotransferase [Paenibacillus odorifer]OME23550.1 hypothetical protein BSK47_03600 [Paenibacillus odorifer]
MHGNSQNETERIAIKSVLYYYFNKELLHYFPLKNGSANKIWQVTANDGVYVLKMMGTSCSADFIEYQNWLSNSLVRHQFPFQPNTTKRGGDVIVSWDQQFWQLRPFLSGRSHQLGHKEDLYRVINTLVDLHSMKIDENCHFYSDSFVNYWSEGALEQYALVEEELGRYFTLQDVKQYSNLFRAIINKFEESSCLDLFRQLPKVVTHGDIHSHNFLMGEEGVIGVIDWDQSGIQPKILDTARSVYILSRIGHNEFAINKDFARFFLHEYNKRLPFLKEEMDLFLLLIEMSFVPRLDNIKLLQVEKFKWFIDWAYRGALSVNSQLEGTVNELRLQLRSS